MFIKNTGTHTHNPGSYVYCVSVIFVFEENLSGTRSTNTEKHLPVFCYHIAQERGVESRLNCACALFLASMRWFSHGIFILGGGAFGVRGASVESFTMDNLLSCFVVPFPAFHVSLPDTAHRCLVYIHRHAPPSRCVRWREAKHSHDGPLLVAVNAMRGEAVDTPSGQIHWVVFSLLQQRN